MGDEPFHNPFAGLKGLPGVPAPEPATQARREGTGGRSSDPPERRHVARAVVRLERAGRRGKEVTVVDHLDLPPPELADWLKALRASLGCGGAVDASRIVLHGDHRARLPGLLAARGVKQVTRG
jgi:translation initiation factor 1